VDPIELTEEIRKFKDSETEKMSDKLGLMLTNIANRFASRPNFRNYSYREDFVSDAILRMVQQIHKINLDHPKCNPFSYLTMTCYHVYIAKITKENKFSKMKDDLTNKLFDDFEVHEQLNIKKRSDGKD
jgi:DNA-directed RNA polymerase specialized sigma24 family protein